MRDDARAITHDDTRYLYICFLRDAQLALGVVRAPPPTPRTGILHLRFVFCFRDEDHLGATAGCTSQCVSMRSLTYS